MPKPTVPAIFQFPNYTAMRRTFMDTHLSRRVRTFILLCYEWAERRNYEALVMRDECLFQADNAAEVLAGAGGK